MVFFPIFIIKPYEHTTDLAVLSDEKLTLRGLFYVHDFFCTIVPNENPVKNKVRLHLRSNSNIRNIIIDHKKRYNQEMHLLVFYRNEIFIFRGVTENDIIPAPNENLKDFVNFELSADKCTVAQGVSGSGV